MTRQRRTPEQLVADLQAKIDAIKQRAERAKTKRDPSLRYIAKAQKAVEAAMAETTDGATRQALQEAHATLTAALALNGVVVAHAAAPRARRVSAEDLGDRLLAHVQKHPGQRGEEIAAALGTDSFAMRPSMKRLVEAGAVKTEGRNRGMRYFGAR